MATDPLDQVAEQLEELEKEDRSEDSYNESPPSDIVAYNELRSCADLYRMTQEGNLIIQPEFQRDFVWQGTAQTRFIDSLAKQLPVPSMCFAFDYKQSLWIVIDGLQRISTINRLLRGEDWKLSVLDDIEPFLKGKNAASLKNATSGEGKIIFSRIQNQALPVNILRCDLTKRSHNEYMFTIFHRLNSGGLKLTNQEIRNCIFIGPFNTLLKELDNEPYWRRLNSMKPKENYRFAKQETILRFFAFRENRDAYKGSMSKFLNDYMFNKRNMADPEIVEKRTVFNSVLHEIATKVFPGVNVPRLPGTVLEAAMLGMAWNLDRVRAANAASVAKAFNDLRGHNSLSPDYLAEGLSKPDRVDARLNAANDIFGAV